jgi:hypothetical protein
MWLMMKLITPPMWLLDIGKLFVMFGVHVCVIQLTAGIPIRTNRAALLILLFVRDRFHVRKEASPIC